MTFKITCCELRKPDARFVTTLLSKDQFTLCTGNRVLPGRVYKFIGWTKLLDRKRTGDVHSLELWIRFKKRGEKAQKKKRLAHRTKYSQGWCKFLIKWRYFYFNTKFSTKQFLKINIRVSYFYLWSNNSSKEREHHWTRLVVILIKRGQCFDM